ncbi:MAG: trimethylamine methyltransferase family protein [Bacteroidetes bacterium]|nr:trimethylamine methyltransferase family protein [Bacteroidota bacterium]
MGNLSLSVLSQNEIEQIHQNTLRIFETTGFKVYHPETLSKFKKLGALVDEQSSTIKPPTKLIKELLKVAPSNISLGGINGKKLQAGGENVYYTSLILDPFVVDWDDGIRLPNLADVKKNTIIGESLDSVSIMMRMQNPVTDVPGSDSYYRTMETFLSNMTKHISAYPDNEQNCRDWIDAAQVIADASGRSSEQPPLLSIAMAVLSPLAVNGTNIEIMKMAMENGYPILSTVCPMAGSTSPYSIAGTFLQANIEALIPVIIAQAYKPGHPVFYGVGPSVTNMQTGKDLYYRSEKMLFKIMANQMSTFYGLPSSGEAGGSLTHLPDIQNGAESFSFLLASHAWKQNIIGGLGSFGNANGMSSEQIVMQCGLIDMAKYLSKGVDFTGEKSGVTSIEQTGPGGNFLMDDLTLSLLRDSEEFFHSPYMDLTGESSEAETNSKSKTGSSKSMLEIAHQKVIDLQNSYVPKVPGKVIERIKHFFYDKYQNKEVSRLD